MTRHDAEDLRHRLRAADPARTGRGPAATSGWLRDLVETTMQTNDQTADRTGGRTPAAASPEGPPPRRPRWVAAVAAAAAVAVLGIGGWALLGDDGAEPAATATPLTLTLPQGDPATQSCLALSADVLAEMPVAFSGTATRVQDGRVVLEVDRWYRGGTAEQVELVAPGGDLVALLGAVTFEEGERYLVSASQGVVSMCGYTAVWSPEVAAVFDEAFTG